MLLEKTPLPLWQEARATKKSVTFSGKMPEPQKNQWHGHLAREK